MKELKIIVLLINNPRYFTKVELAEKLKTTVRTIERNIIKLKEAGFVFNELRGKVALCAESKVCQSLSDLVYFSDEEAATLYNAIEAIEGDSQGRKSLREKLAILYSTDTVKEKIIKMNRSHKVRDLMTAIEKRRRVIFHNYSSPSSRTTTDRLVEPYQLCNNDKMVWCWEVESGKNKMFNISRIESVEILHDVCWQDSMRHQPAFTDAFRNISFNGTTFPVRLRMNQMAYNLMLEEYPLTEADITQTAENQWTYEAEVSSYRGIGRFVIGLADCITVESPGLQGYIENFVKLYLK